MNSPAYVDFQSSSSSSFLIEHGSDIFAYLHQLTDDYPLQNIKFFETNDGDDDTISFLPLERTSTNYTVKDQENNISYFTMLEELKAPMSPGKWVLIDCNDINFVGLCDLIFRIFRELENNFDITIPSCQPNSDLCLIGFGERSIQLTSGNDIIHNSKMATYFLEKMIRIILLFNQTKFNLSLRELECIEWVGKGKTSSEVGTILSITESTVDKHVAAVCQKLDAVNRMQMIAKAVRIGLI